MLWLCLHFFDLSVACFSSDKGADRPLFVSESGRIIGGNRQARQQGIEPGMTPTAARALSIHAEHRTRAPERERRLLEQLATWAGRFTPAVSLEPPTALLLEIEGSLRYFRGLEALRQRILEDLRSLGQHAAIGIAPTPTAAWLLARAGDDGPITDRQDLGKRLDALPVTVLPTGQERAPALQGLGCACLGDIRALPGEGIGRRLGRELLETLQRAHGERPDPRRHWQPPARFDHRLDFTEAITAIDTLRPGLQQLIESLCVSLRRRDAGIRRLRFLLHHRNGRPTRLVLGVLAHSRDPRH